eukprot:UN05516
MWFAVLGSYQHNAWLISFMYKILSAHQDILQLIDENNYVFSNRFEIDRFINNGTALNKTQRNALQKKRKRFTKYMKKKNNPKYITAVLYHYHYAPFSDRKKSEWWTREYVRDYLSMVPVQTKQQIEHWLKTNNFTGQKAIYSAQSKDNAIVKYVRNVRYLYENRVHTQFGPVVFVQSLIFTALILRTMNIYVKQVGITYWPI